LSYTNEFDRALDKPLRITWRQHTRIRIRVQEPEVDSTENHSNRQRQEALTVMAPLIRPSRRAFFNPIKGSKIGELAARFEIVVGRTPDERDVERRADRKR
jgi:hypothetical protein